MVVPVTSAGASEPAYTIDEVALAAGLPSRTVRHYQSEGTLPPPRRVGRVAFYGPQHLERLRLIGRLQDRGLRLDAIRDALREVERGNLSLEAWLGLSDQVRAPWSADSAVLLDEAELRARFGELDPGILASLLQTDLVRRAEDRYLVPSPRIVEVVLRLRAAGIDVDTAIGALDVLRKQSRRTAEELVSYLLKRTGKGFARAGAPEDVAQALAALRADVGATVEVLVGQEMERAVRAAFEQGRPRLARQPKMARQ
jgi:DNA-binding transcriptional MerR regulator